MPSTTAPPARLPFAGQVCLSMIVRNESAVIGRCLAAVRPLIGAWAIVDTGSEDGTQARIRDLLGDLPGSLIERPWVDFATNRNQALDLAREHGQYALIVDADEVVEPDPQHAWPLRLDAPGYSLRVYQDGGSVEYDCAKLLRHDAGWRWHGVLHEYPATPIPAPLQRLEGLRVRGIPDGARSRRPQHEKYADDARVLETALKTDPDNARYVFYYAQSLRDAGQPASALEAYRRRAAMGGWDEEVWYARYQVACLHEALGHDEPTVIDAYLAAYESRPQRAEPLCDLARFLRLRGRYASAHLYARAAAEQPQPDDLLFVDRSVYRWRARDEQAVSAYYIGRRAECAALCTALLTDPALPAAERERIAANAAWR